MKRGLITNAAEMPRRAKRDGNSLMEAYEEFQQLKAMVLHNRLKPFQQVGFYVDTTDPYWQGMAHPERAAVDRMRFFLDSLNLRADYTVVKFRTGENEHFIRLTYEPPVTQAVPQQVPAAVPARKRAGR